MKSGKIIKEFAPTKQNRRNSEGAFIRMKDGAIAFAFTRYRSGHEDGNGADLAVSFSYDEGETFGKERVVLTYEECNAMNIMSVSLLDLGDQIGVYYLKKEKGLLCRLFMRKTVDFISFSEEKICTDVNAYIVVNNDRVRKLSDGRVVFPCAYYDLSTKPEDVDNDNYHSAKWRMPPSEMWFYSSASGEDFEVIGRAKNPYKILETGSDSGLQEPGVVECGDFLYVYIRNMSGRQLETISRDGGYTWSTPTLSRFTSPPSPMSTLTLSNGDILVGYNPAPLYWGRGQSVDGVWTGGRTPYVLEIANPDMSPKTSPFAIETDEKSGFCYCAMLETSDGVLLGYCAGSTRDEGGTLTRLRIRKIKKEELY